MLYLTDPVGLLLRLPCSGLNGSSKPVCHFIYQKFTSRFVNAVSSNGARSNRSGKLPPLDIPEPSTSKKWALQESEFGPGLVGGKSSSLAFLRAKVSTSALLRAAE